MNTLNIAGVQHIIHDAPTVTPVTHSVATLARYVYVSLDNHITVDGLRYYASTPTHAHARSTPTPTSTPLLNRIRLHERLDAYAEAA